MDKKWNYPKIARRVWWAHFNGKQFGRSQANSNEYKQCLEVVQARK